MSKENIESKQITLKFGGDMIEQLQEIGKDILTNYIVKLGSDKKYLIPVWIEAYCYKEHCFEDQACDGLEEKKAIANTLGKRKNIGEKHSQIYISHIALKIKIRNPGEEVGLILFLSMISLLHCLIC